MQSLALTRKSFSIVVNNFGVLARLTLPVYAVYMALQAVYLVFMLGGLKPGLFLEPPQVTPDPAAMGRAYLVLLVAMTVSALMAIRVHRWVLKEDTALGRAMAPGVWGRYLLKGLLLFIVLIGLAIVAVVPIMLVLFAVAPQGETLPVWFWVVYSGVTVALALTLMRFATILPAAAVGDRLGLGGAWKATSGMTLAIFVAILANMGLGAVLGQVVGYAMPANAFGWAVQMLTYWPFFLWWVTILTSLYGYGVQGRSLES